MGQGGDDEGFPSWTVPTCTYVSSRRCLSRIARHVSVVISALRYLHNTSARQACRNTRAGMPGAPSLPPSTVPPPPNARSVPLPRHAILSHFRREWRTIVDLIRIPQAKVSNSLSLSLFLAAPWRLDDTSKKHQLRAEQPAVGEVPLDHLRSST